LNNSSNDPLFPEDLLFNVFWHALTTEQATLAVSATSARRHPADVVPFAALREMSDDALAQLRGLMQDGEELFVAWSEQPGSSFPVCPGLEYVMDLNALQMVPTREPGTSPGDNHAAIEPLTAANASEMVALTGVAFPGFFRARTYLMGRYWGIRSGGELIAMAGERVAVPGMREISAVCTHPAHTGRGHAARLIRHVQRVHAADGLKSFLHVSENNDRAIALYKRLGFAVTGATRCTRVRRAPVTAA
jgi:ribosomal protein S18 acetylase RimI-like enzyme